MISDRLLRYLVRQLTDNNHFNLFWIILIKLFQETVKKKDSNTIYNDMEKKKENFRSYSSKFTKNEIKPSCILKNLDRNYFFPIRYQKCAVGSREHSQSIPNSLIKWTWNNFFFLFLKDNNFDEERGKIQNGCIETGISC